MMSAMAFQTTSLAIVYSTVSSGADQRKFQSSAPLAFVRGIHRWPVNSPYKGSVTRKMFPIDDVIMLHLTPSSFYHTSVHNSFFPSFPAWMYQRPYRPGGCPDGQLLLGVVLSGTRSQPGRYERVGTQWQLRRRRIVHHVLQWDGRRQTRPKGSFCGPRT